MSKQSYPNRINDWQKLLGASNDNAADLPQLETIRTDLQKTLDRALAISSERNSLRTRSLELSRDLEVVVLEGRDLAIKLRAGVKSHYGATSDRLLQFEIKPIRRTLRGERRTKKAAGGDQPPTTAPQQTIPQQPGATKQQVAAKSPAEAG